MSRKLKEPTQHDWKRLVRVVRYLKGTRSAGVRMRKPTQTAKNVVELDMFSDTDFAGCLETRRAMTCGLYFTDGQPMYGFARRQGVQSTSSGEAELYGASSVAFDGRLIKELLEWLGFTVIYRLHVDSSRAKAMINRDGVGNVKHLDVRALWLQQEREKNGLKVMKVPGERNPADLGTKAHPAVRFELLKQLCGITDCSAIDRAMEVGIHAIEAWGATPGSVHNGRGLLAKMVALSTLLVQARGESMEYQEQADEGETCGWWLVALLGWLVALVAVCCCAKLARKMRTVRVRTVGVQTTTTCKRHYAVPRMCELKDGECGTWVD